MLVMATTGIRRGEARALTWQDMDLDAGALPSVALPLVSRQMAARERESRPPPRPSALPAAPRRPLATLASCPLSLQMGERLRGQRRR